MAEETRASPPDLTQRVCLTLGFSASLGPDLIRHALRDAGVELDTPAPDDYLKALPELESRLRTYLTEDDARGRLQRLRELLAELTPPAPRTTTPDPPPD